MSKRQPFVMIPKASLKAASEAGPSAHLLLVVLYQIQNDAKPKERELFRAGAGRIGRYCGLSRRTIQAKIKKLEEVGLISIKSGRRANRSSDKEENQITLITGATIALVEGKKKKPTGATIALVEGKKRGKLTSAGDALVERANWRNHCATTSATIAPQLAQPLRSLKEVKNKETLSTLSKPKRESQKRERVEVMIQRVAKELNTPEEQVEAHWEKHRGSMAGMKSGAYATPNTFAKYMDGQPRPKPQATPEETKGRWVKVIDSAKGERAHYWSQWPDAVSQTWEDARSNEKGEFMQSIPGASYLALAEAKSNNGSTFTITPESGEIVPSV